MHEYRDEELAQALNKLPVPTRPDDFFARLRAQITPSGRRPRFLERRRLVATMALVGLALVVGGFAGSELAGSTRAATSTPVPAFTPAIGWNIVETNNRRLGVAPALDLAWAANIPFAPQDTQTDWPTETLKTLPPGGIVIVVVGPWEYSGNNPIPDLKAPVRVEDLHFERANWWEGQPAPNVSRYWTSAHINAQDIVNVFVWMGSDDPTPALKAAADEELTRLTLPS
jgi:hypothetical protein